MTSDATPAKLHRVFTDAAGHAWTVRWSAAADISPASERVIIRPPGLHFTCPMLQGKRFLFYPDLLPGELEAMPVSRLQQLLERADTPG